MLVRGDGTTSRSVSIGGYFVVRQSQFYNLIVRMLRIRFQSGVTSRRTYRHQKRLWIVALARNLTDFTRDLGAISCPPLVISWNGFGIQVPTPGSKRIYGICAFELPRLHSTWYFLRPRFHADTVPPRI